MKTILTAIFLIFFAVCSQAEIVVIANKANLSSLSSVQLEDIFMGRSRSFSNGRIALPLDQLTLRAAFYQKLTAKPIEQINAYWVRLMFTGQTTPPSILPNDKAVLTTVSENKDTIGYIDSKSVDNSVRILLRLN